MAEDTAGIEQRLAAIEAAIAQQLERTTEALGLLKQARKAQRYARTTLDGGDGAAAGAGRGVQLRRENIVPVDEPLALICQAPRSGGTLLARLFDGHPQCHAHPHELHIGDQRPHVWPEFGVNDHPEDLFETLQEKTLVELFAKGKRQIPLKGPGESGAVGQYPFICPPAFQRLLFLDEVERRSPIESERQILDAYMTSLFNAWLDNQNLRGAEKRWVVAFSPRRAWGEGLDKLFELYPDGRLISILRDPESWYSSAKGRDPDAEPEALIERWQRSAREMIEAKRRFSEQVRIVGFDQLVLDTPGAMRGLAEFLEIDFVDELTTPTFNGYPVGANSSYEVRETGVVTDPVKRHEDTLSAKQRELVRRECGELYSEASSVVDSEPS